jgi:hypothetical protein
MAHARGNNVFIACALALVLACGATAFGAQEEPTVDKQADVDKPADEKKDKPAKEPVPIRALTSEQLAEARKGRDRADLMRADLEKRMSVARREAREETGERQPHLEQFDGEADLVANAYEEVMTRYPHTEVAAYCMLRLAGHYMYQYDLDAAEQLMKKTAREFRGTPEETDAIFSLGLFYLQSRHEPAKAMKWFVRIPKPGDGPYDEASVRYLSAQQSMTKCELFLGRDAEAKKRTDDLKQVFPQYADEIERTYQSFVLEARQSRQ